MKSAFAMALALLVASAARGQDNPPPAAAESKPPEQSPVRVRATHRVDVIAPGEHVETIPVTIASAEPIASRRHETRD